MAPTPARERKAATSRQLLLELRFPALAESLGKVRPSLRRTLMDCGFGCIETEDLVLAVCEACQNVIEHAYGQVDAEQTIHLRLLIGSEELTVELRDFAGPVDPSAIYPRPLDEIRPGGLGTHFIETIFDRHAWSRPAPGDPDGPLGNILTLGRTLSAAKAASQRRS